MRTKPDRPASRRAGRREKGTADPSSVRFVTLTLVAVVGIAVGSVVGAVAYRYDNWLPQAVAAGFRWEPSNSEISVQAESSKPRQTGTESVASVETTADPQAPKEDTPQQVRKPIVTEKDHRPAAPETPDDLTVASIDRAVAEKAPRVLPADSPRFAMTFKKPPVTAVRQTDQPQAPERLNLVTAPVTPAILAREPAVLPTQAEQTEVPATSETAPEFGRPLESEEPVAETGRSAATGLRPARALRYVSLRAGPDRETRELAVIPTDADIVAEDDCRRWCRVIFDGQSGYIYSTYFEYREIEAVEVAESEADAIAIENRLAKQGVAHFELPAASATPAAAPSRDDQRFRWSTTKEFVNLRAAPDKDSEVIVIVPANRRILTEENCTHWCVAIHNGQQGFIYKAYIQPPG